MNNDNRSYQLEKEVLELKQYCVELYQELETIKILLQKRQISPKQFLLFVKVLIIILVGVNTQNGNFQFSGEQIIPMVDVLSTSESIENNL